MNTYLSRLNPSERRFVVFVALVLFIVINLVWVRPHFSDWSKWQRRLAAALDKQQSWEATMRKAERLEKELSKLGGEDAAVPLEDQAIEFLRTIQAAAARAGVTPTGIHQTKTRTNQFTIEQSQTINVVSGEKQLVDFLFNLGSENSLIRARDLSVRPDQPRYQLNAGITLVASYQKKSARTAAPPPAKTGTAQKPASVAKPAAVQTNAPAAAVRTNVARTPPPAVKPATVRTSSPAVTLPPPRTAPPAHRPPTVRTSPPPAMPPAPKLPPPMNQ
jgi:hypothetical protein